MFLTDEEKKMLNGDYGPGTQMAISILKRWGEAFDAEKMAKVNYAHISTNLPTDMLASMAEGVSQVRTTASLHAVLNPTFWREKYGIKGKKGQLLGGLATFDEEEFIARQSIFKRLGFLPTFTCIPYAIGIVLRQGDVFIATGSSGQVAANSLFAARANRESASTALAAAITGVTPYMGLLKQENRHAQLVIKTEGLDFENFTNADYGVLGYFIGETAGTKNVVITGLPTNISLEQCKYLTSPLPVSGAVTMCHMVGITPEAPTLEAALGGNKPDNVVKCGVKEFEEAYQKLNDAGESGNVDLVVIGCPHCLISELRDISMLLGNKKVKEGVKLIVATSNSTYALAKDAGYADIIEQSGGIICNVCASGSNPYLYLSGAETAATNSARGAHYIQRQTGGKIKTYYGDLKKCISSTINGKWRA